jgi:hypothetical protein
LPSSSDSAGWEVRPLTASDQTLASHLASLPLPTFGDRSMSTIRLDTGPAAAAALIEAGADVVLLTPVRPLCPRTVGALCHVLEAAGLATVGLIPTVDIPERMAPPRSLVTCFPLGRPLGRPDDPAFQTGVLLTALDLLGTGSGPVTEPDSGADLLAGFDRVANAVPWKEARLPRDLLGVARAVLGYCQQAAQGLSDRIPRARQAETWCVQHTAAGATMRAARDELRRQGAPQPLW